MNFNPQEAHEWFCFLRALEVLLLSGKVQESPPSPPLRTQHESFQLTTLKPYFKQ